MAIELVCSCGAVLHFEDAPATRHAQCPECQATVTVPKAETSLEQRDAPAAVGRKPLWALMGRPPEIAGATAGSAGPLLQTNLAGETTAPEPPITSEPLEHRPARKGLWGVMRTAPSAKNQVPDTERPPLPADSAPEHTRPASSEPSAEVVVAAVPHVTSDPALEALFQATAQASLATASDTAARVRARHSRRAIWSCALGVASLPIALLALIDTVWSRLPAPLIGFVAILMGLVASQEIQRSAGRVAGRKYAKYGIIAGIVGSFLGPVVMSGLGRWLVHSSHQGFTTSHLKTIGAALTEYEKQRGSFPPGGIFRKNKAGDLRGYHGWMTMLLPWVGEGDLYAAIRQNLPYDDKANLAVFEQDVPVFFASGTDQSKVRGRFGASHFAGVGGEIRDDQAGDKRVLHLGLFGVDSTVTRDDVTDGLSHTLAAGEIADDLPAWGDPENWRSIGRGLNRDRQGFANHDRTGACFLMADGSVRFFSNKTDVRVLTALSTRDGGEP